VRLTYLYTEEEQLEKVERPALKFLRRSLDEKSPTLKNFAKVVRELEQRRVDEWQWRNLANAVLWASSSSAKSR